MAVTTRLYRDADRKAFAELNRDWIEEFFVLEASDREQLENPEASILGKGGQIVIAELDGLVVGTGAIVPPHHDPDDGRNWLEIVKMAARKDVRGQGIGQAVMDALIAQARELGADAIWLETNADLKAAVRLYERSGFRPLGTDELWPTPYARCNVQMVLLLEDE
ncbi:MAG: GNAT family N-acetyltransferase [Sphingomonadales bacterium]|nr:GNAT family N-acetyltransferase [Sphingomonadales bacterium]PIX64877.1 MAG: GNAT family N-acetyltransferase [Sphingomonadales bacterium CG_4_10_14_3_um_filter_58_15]NCO47877.1 GNAT family N-acetyltransferase [Sphingomonadales bacterium]NCO99238.1 GNAT family N-acetyltransferase [Sphingomonadales bacterium]NCP27643.1 GNAT family N-acetyltransferase [Sphingomonadales bacterium]